MNQKEIRPNYQLKTSNRNRPKEISNSNLRNSSQQDNQTKTENNSEQIVKTINSLSNGLKNYPIRDLVKHAEQFGFYLKSQKLETNQVRKFLDAINRLKADLTEKNDFPKLKQKSCCLNLNLPMQQLDKKQPNP